MEEDEASATPDHPLYRWAGWGLVPLFVLTAWLVAISPGHIWRDATILLLSAYAAAILSFVAGLRCGLEFAAKQSPRRRDFAFTLAPAALGWLAVAMPSHIGFALLAVAFAAQGAWDSLGVDAGPVPERLGRQRIRLTLLAIAAMVAAAMATA